MPHACSFYTFLDPLDVQVTVSRSPFNFLHTITILFYLSYLLFFCVSTFHDPPEHRGFLLLEFAVHPVCLITRRQVCSMSRRPAMGSSLYALYINCAIVYIASRRGTSALWMRIYDTKLEEWRTRRATTKERCTESRTRP
ncbi:hypothetical protein BS17DRAFT_91002 [Gyrodon lividus]|nr:hypothetical protein BS17DRAFT_91002 [Gyrodon lividus]